MPVCLLLVIMSCRNWFVRQYCAVYICQSHSCSLVAIGLCVSIVLYTLVNLIVVVCYKWFVRQYCGLHLGQSNCCSLSQAVIVSTRVLLMSARQSVWRFYDVHQY